jgi:hypothetical protein
MLRNRFTPNEFIIEGDVCRIKLYDRHGNEKAEAIIDAEDYDKVKNYKWYFKDNTRVHCKSKGLYLHHAIIGKPEKGFEVDHRNMDGKNNKKGNLRVVKRPQNVWNTRLSSRNITGYKGISLHKYSGLWHVRITANKKIISIGYFKDKDKAVEAYDEAANKYHGEFARTNKMIRGQDVRIP